MFRIWGKIIKDNHMLKDCVYQSSDKSLSRTKKVFEALDCIAHEFDLPVPIWLEVNIRDFKRCSKARFTQDSFVESIDFDYLEVQVIEED